MNFIEATLKAAASKPVILVILSGGAVCLGKYKDDPRVSAIIFGGYPGQEAGVGVAEVIFGKYAPSGRLSQTFYSQPFVSEVSFFDMGMRPRASSGDETDVGNPGRGYRFYSGSNVVYPFGHGLSYTSFQYSWSTKKPVGALDNGKSIFNATAGIYVDEVVVQNVGKVSSAETVLVFLLPPHSAQSSGDPRRSLRFFDKVFLNPTESQAVSIQLTSIDFSLADEGGVVSVTKGEWTLSVGDLVKSVWVN